MSLKVYMSNMRMKSKLLDCFRSSGIYFANKRGNKTIYYYPKIHSCEYKNEENKTQLVFTLRNGQDPKEIKQKEYIFQQYFGKNIEIKGDLKKFILNVYHKRMSNELVYSYKAIKEELKGKLPIPCGINQTGKYRTFDLTIHPHILIAGETGSGKSSMLRNILTTLIQYKEPSDLQLYLVDCKKSEFGIFRKVEHVQCVLNKVSDIRKMLTKIKEELDERSDLTDTFEVTHIDDLPSTHKKPYVIVCIDEFVMLRKDEAIMDILTEIVAIGRTLGVFAVLSMQRPSADILDTSIRANLTVRMGFKVADKINANIINTEGAEKIEEPGRFKLRIGELEEIQSPFLEADKAKEILSKYYVTKGNVKEVNEDNEEQPKEESLFGMIEGEIVEE